MDVYTFLIVTHLAGTVLGIGGATMIELHLKKALENQEVSEDERAILGVDYGVVRVGLFVSILSGFGFLLFYRYNGYSAALYDPILWAKLIIVLVIGANSLLLQARKISLYWGAAFSFVSWWMVGLLGVYLTNGSKFDVFGGTSFISSFVSVLVVYAIAVAIGAFVLDLTRKYIRKTV